MKNPQLIMCQIRTDFFGVCNGIEKSEARQMLLGRHKAVLDLIEQLSDEELFEKKHFSWTGTTSLGSYCISATSSHYDWAIKKIKAHKVTCRV